VRLFADDTIAYLTISSDQDARTFQSDLDKLDKWEKSWLMAFHPEKCNVLTITKKRNSIKFNYTLHGHSFEHVTSAEYIGNNIFVVLVFIVKRKRKMNEKWNVCVFILCQ
jgi:hypothetical protein